MNAYEADRLRKEARERMEHWTRSRCIMCGTRKNPATTSQCCTQCAKPQLGPWPDPKTLRDPENPWEKID